MRWLNVVGLAASFAATAPQIDQAAPGDRPGGAGATAAAEAPAEPKLEGVVIARPEGGFLQATLEGNSLQLRFYDEKKQPAKLDVDRGAVRLQFPARDPERYVLTPNAEGTALTHARPIRPPHVFKVYLSLFRGASESAVESHTFDYPAR